MNRTALVVAASVALAGAAVAEDTIAIDTASVDFTDSAQVEVVYAEIVAASETVCSSLYLDIASIRAGLASSERMYDACVAQTVEDTIVSADVPALTALYEMEMEEVEDFTIALND